MNWFFSEVVEKVAAKAVARADAAQHPAAETPSTSPDPMLSTRSPQAEAPKSPTTIYRFREPIAFVTNRRTYSFSNVGARSNWTFHIPFSSVSRPLLLGGFQ